NPGGSLGVHLRLMPLGDSITYGIGSSDGSGYRARLWDDLAGNNVDFVGSQQSGRVPDPDNEGHSGWVIDQLTGLVKTSPPSYRPTPPPRAVANVAGGFPGVRSRPGWPPSTACGSPTSTATARTTISWSTPTPARCRRG